MTTKKKQTTGAIVRRTFKDRTKGKYYYIDKGTGKRTTAQNWQKWQNFKKAEGTIVDIVPQGEPLTFYGTSMSNVFNSILYKSRGSRLYGIDANGKKHRISKKNVHKILLQTRAAQNDWYEAEKLNREADGRPRISSDEYYKHLLFQLQLSEMYDNVFYANMEDYELDTWEDFL